MTTFIQIQRLLLLLGVTAVTNLHATTYYVNNATGTGVDSDNRNGTNSTTQAWRTLQYASTRVTAAGHTIQVMAGTYDEKGTANLGVGVSLKGTLNAGGDPITTIRPASTFTSASQLPWIVRMESAAMASGNQGIQDIAFDGRNHVATHAVTIRKRSNVTIRNVIMKDCYRTALEIYGNYASGTADEPTSWLTPPADSTYCSNILVENCLLTNNGLWPGGTANWSYASIAFEGLLNSTIRNCTIDESSYGGAGVKGFLFKNSTVSGCNIKLRPIGLGRAKDFGIEIWYVRASQFFDNETNGGLSIAFNENTSVHHNRVVMPAGEGTTEGLEFGGANCSATNNYFEGCNPTAINCWSDNRGIPQPGIRIQNNVIRNSTNGILVSAGNVGTVIYPALFDDLRIENNTIDGASELWGGGAIAFRVQTEDGAVIVEDGVSYTTFSADITNTKIRNNIVTNTAGSTKGYGMTFGGRNGGTQFAAHLTGTELNKNMFWNNAKGATFKVAGLGSFTELNSITANPLYKATGTAFPSPYYELQASSPAIGTGIDVGLPKLVNPNLGAWVQPSGQRVEAEMNYSITDDPGTNAIATSNTNLDSYKGVKIFDQGDKARIHFTVPTDGNYTLTVRLRSGDSSSTTSYFSGGYTFKIDGLDAAFTGNTGSVSAADGSVYWGTMNSPTVFLAKGLHHVEVRCATAWGYLDWLELTSVP